MKVLDRMPLAENKKGTSLVMFPIWSCVQVKILPTYTLLRMHILCIYTLNTSEDKSNLQ